MIAQSFSLVRYDADEGKVFDWKEPHFTTDENGDEVREYLNAKTLFIGGTDSITNYVEVDEQGNASECGEIVASEDDYIAALADLGVE